MKKIAVLTSGGDSPGMNAAIRAIVGTCLSKKIVIYGIKNGYQGLINNNFVKLKYEDVENIIQRGGTILNSSRSEKFRTKEGRKIAFQNLKNKGIDGLIAIGGDGTFTGANIFYKEYKFPIIGIPGTIDNDLFGTDHTIGYDTALNTVVDAIDKIRDTAQSHNRIFFIEVMGRDTGFIALNSGVAGGAKSILIPEDEHDTELLEAALNKRKKRNMSSFIVMVAEGDEAGGAKEIAKKMEKKFPNFEIRITILGHIQRGGNPSAYDRILATRLGVAAVRGLLDNRKNEMAGTVANKIVFTPLKIAINNVKTVNRDLLRVYKYLGF